MLRFILPCLVRVAGALFLCSGQAWACQWLGPCPDKPYVLAESFVTAATPVVANWRWEDARTQIESDNRATTDGYVFADNVVRPRPLAYIQQEFSRQLAEHEDREAIIEKISGQTIKLIKLEMSVGLWFRGTEHAQGRWDFMRVKMRIDIDGTQHEALGVHRFNSRDKPSPMSPPMKDAVAQLLNLVHAFQ